MYARVCVAAYLSRVVVCVCVNIRCGNVQYHAATRDVSLTTALIGWVTQLVESNTIHRETRERERERRKVFSGGGLYFPLLSQLNVRQ